MLHKPQPLRLSRQFALLLLVAVSALIGAKILGPLPSSPTKVSPDAENGRVTAAETESRAAEQVLTPPELASSPQELSQETQAARVENYGSLPLSFEINRGQTDPSVKFLARGEGYGLFLTSSAAVLSLNQPASTGLETENATKSPTSKRTVLSFSLQGAARSPATTGVDKLPGTVNYFLGNDQSKWRKDVPTYSRVRYHSVYRGIDVVYYGNQKQLEYDFVVAPEGDPGAIRMQVTGAEGLRVDANGDLLLTTPGGDVIQRKPFAYQEANGERHEVAANYLLKGNTVSFEIGDYDKAHPVIIDPVLLYSTYLGGGSGDFGLAVTVDAQGSAFLTGNAASIDFPLVAPFQASNQGFLEDAFVAKLNQAGTALVYSTYLGGSGGDSANSIAIDTQGNAYVAGLTTSDNFPVTAGSVQVTRAGVIDAFVTKLNPSGSALVYSTYLGGDNNDQIFGIAVRADGRAYVAGRTDSTRLVSTPLQRRGHPAFKSLNGGASWSPGATGLTASNVIAFASNPANSNLIYAGTTNGVFKSVNAGASWTITGTDNVATAPEFTTSLVVDPSDPNVIYVGTLEGGVHKSTNGGGLYVPKNNGFPAEVVNALAIDPVNPSTLYAGTVFGMFKTTNGGDTWVEINNGITNIVVNELAIDPTNPATVYAGTQRGMFKTTNGGGLWAPINDGPINSFTPISVLTIDPLNSAILYAAQTFGGLFKTTNGGTTWTSLTNGLPLSVVGAIAVDPVTSSTLYAGTTGRGIYKSIDSGASWTESNTGLSNMVVSALLVDRNSPATVYAGTVIGSDAFAARLDPNGSTLDQLISFGGDETDEARGVAIDSAGLPYIVGSTSSTNFPLANAFQSTIGGFSDAFVAKLNAAGSGFVYSTYLGGSNTDLGRAIAVRGESAYVVGITGSSNFPTANAYQAALNQVGTDAFVTKLNPAGSALEFSTYFGGGSSEQGLGVAVDIDGNVYLTGSTFSADLPTLEAPQSVRGGQTDAFVTKFNPSGTSLAYSTYLGGTSADQGNGIAVDLNGNAYIIGNTASAGFPTVNPFQPTKGSGTDVFITKIGIQADLSVAKRDSRDPVLVNSPFTYTLNVNNSGPSLATGVTVVDTLPSSLTLNAATPTQGTCSLNNSILTCNLGTLAPAAGAVIAVSVTPTATGTITNTATVTGNEPDVNSANNTAAETTKISASPSIRGHVKDPSNVGVSGVLMTLTGTETRTVQTDSAGFYQFAELSAGGNYVITATKANLSIEPESVTFNGFNADQTADFVAYVCTYSITPLTGSFSAAGGTGMVSVTSLRGCSWTATSSDSWLNITSGASGSGSGTVNFSVSPTTVPRAAHLTIAGLNFAVYQEFNSCLPSFSVSTYNLSNSSTVVRAGDLNADGRIDLVTANGGGLSSGGGIEVAVFRNDGAGSFTLSIFNTSLGGLEGLVLTDFNGDAIPDIAVSNFHSAFVRVFFNDGNGTFGQSRVDVPFNPSSFGTRGLVTADLNGDGHGDLLVNTTFPSNVISVLIANGSGGFNQTASINGGFSSVINTSDFNNDGKVDLLLAAGAGSSPIGVMLGDGQGGFGPIITSGGVDALTVIATIGDLNGDGRLDLVDHTTITTSSPPSTFTGLVVLTGDGTGHFAKKSTVSQEGAAGLTVGDFNRDGKADVAYTHGSTRVKVVLGDGVGGLGNPIEVDTGGNNQFPGNVGIVAADLNSDGRPDLAAANYTTGAKVLLNNCPAASTNILISDVNVIEGSSGVANAVFNVRLSAPSSQTVGVSYNTLNGTAIAGSDYVATSGSLSFTAGETEKTITVPVNGDTLTEPNETFAVHLFTPQNATISKALGTGTILNDDAALQMSSPSYLVSEDQLRVDITVTRTGSTSAPASVDYATSDTAGLANCSVVNGVASSRCDYATSVGRLSFAAGESTKTISIPIVDDTYAEGNESFTITLSNVAGVPLGTPATATVTITDNETINGPNPIDQTSFFVRQHYIDFLGREPDPAGAAAWEAVINTCPAGDINCDRIHVSSAFFRSPEFQGRGYFVYRFYPVAFGRKPDFVEFIPDLAKVSGFLSDAELEAAKVAFIAEFMSRPAFVTKYNGLNDTQYVDTLLSTAQVTSPHRGFWIAALGNGTRTRATVLRDIAESPEVYNKYYNQAFVVMQYFGYLRRDPDALYLDWIAVLDSNPNDYRGMVNGFMNSLEYRFRFGP